MDKVKIRATSAPWWGGVELLVVDGDHVGSRIKMVQRDPAEIVEPTMRITMDHAQTLMDDLWRSGLRPTEGSGSAGALKAVERHVSDLRKITFKSLGIDNEVGK